MWLVVFAATVHLFCTPYSKVEESFNIQATHDILFHKYNLKLYDHHEFPGVVPRTFIGPLALSFLSSPIALLLEIFDAPKFICQYVVRLVLASLVSLAWNNFSKSISVIYGKEVHWWFKAITISQFHFIFYMSRTLPNILALPIVLWALSAWIRKERVKFIWLSGLCILVFRFELILYFGLLLLHDIIFNYITLKSLIENVTSASILILTVTMSIDSIFWNRVLWPEGEVLWYNTILNKSSNWGRSPFLWYFYSALPRAMGFSVILVPLGLCIERRIRTIGAYTIIFVFLYSFLPHKELRFIIYVFPVLNLISSCFCNYVYKNKSKSKIWKILAFSCAMHLIANICFTIFLLIVSSKNYPGGNAISRLHSMDNNSNKSVHITNLVAQTGFTRFFQNENWTYNKTENFKYDDEESVLQFDYLLTELDFNTKESLVINKHFNKIGQIKCYNGISFQYKEIKFLAIKMKPCVNIMKRKYNMSGIDHENLESFAADQR